MWKEVVKNIFGKKFSRIFVTFLKFHEVKIEICDRFDVDIAQFLGRGRARLLRARPFLFI
jgi:hypothetical protein